MDFSNNHWNPSKRPPQILEILDRRAPQPDNLNLESVKGFGQYTVDPKPYKSQARTKDPPKVPKNELDKASKRYSYDFALGMPTADIIPEEDEGEGEGSQFSQSHQDLSNPDSEPQPSTDKHSTDLNSSHNPANHPNPRPVIVKIRSPKPKQLTTESTGAKIDSDFTSLPLSPRASQFSAHRYSPSKKFTGTQEQYEMSPPGGGSDEVGSGQEGQSVGGSQGTEDNVEVDGDTYSLAGFKQYEERGREGGNPQDRRGRGSNFGQYDEGEGKGWRGNLANVKPRLSRIRKKRYFEGN